MNNDYASVNPSCAHPPPGQLQDICYLGPVSRKSRELFGPEKPFVKLQPAYSVKLVFSYVVKGIKIKITAKFRASKRLRFEDAKGMSPEIHPKSFGTFQKQAPCQFRGLGALANLTRPGGRVFANPWEHPRAFDTHVVTSEKRRISELKVGSL